MARYRYSIWLDSDKDDELLLMDNLDNLKKSRLYSKTIRDGVRLLLDLRAGRTDVLAELFPWAVQGGAQPSGFTRIEAAQADEPVIEVREQEVDAGAAAENFLGSLMALSG